MAGLFDDLPDVKPSAPSAPPSALKPTANLFGDIAPEGSWTDNLRDPIAGVLKIGPTAVKGVADIARLLTGDRVGADLSGAMQRGMSGIDESVGSERLRHQKQQVSNILQSGEFGMKDIPGMVVDNPRAAIDAAVSTIGSMFLPAGAAAGAVRALPAAARVAPVLAGAAPGAVATGTTIATGAAQNAAETFADTSGQDLSERYKGAGISGLMSLLLGGLMRGGAEGVVARRLAGEVGGRGVAAGVKSAAATGAKEFVQEFGEEGSNTLAKQVAKGEDIDPNAIGKQGLYGGIIGLGVGGASDAATNIGNVGPGSNARILARELDQAAQEFADKPVAPIDARNLFADISPAPRTPESTAETVAPTQAVAGPAAQNGLQPEASSATEQVASGAVPVVNAATNPAEPVEDQASGAIESESAPVLQNRDRSTPGSVAQMQSIAAAPDYGRLGFSRDFANGAPVVAGSQVVPEQQLGRQDVAVASDGRRIPVQYAVVEAADVLPSNQVDGAPNADYATATDRMRAIAGNGRIAGLQAAHLRGTGRAYVDELLADNLHGINPDVVRGMRQPVLVRIMPTSEVTADIGDVSNTTGNLDLSAVEQARNDAQRVDLDALQFSEDGGITAEAARAFVRGMPQAEHGALLDTNGQPTRQAMDRLNAAVFSRAYGNDGLVRLYAQAQDPEARLVLSALARLAPKMARLEGAGALDLRDVVAQAAELAVNARRAGRRIADAAAQMDMAADPMVGVVLDLFARNPRSNREAIEQLGRAADMAYAEANKADTDMFGAVPKASRADVFKQMEPATNEQASPQNLEQPAGAGPIQVDAGRTAAESATTADAGRAQAGRSAESDRAAVVGDANANSSSALDLRPGAQRAPSAGPVATDGGSDAAGRARDEERDGNRSGRRVNDPRAPGASVPEAVPAGASTRERAANLTTDTPAFRRWFGDSKVVDENGQPLVMYHGTSASQDGEAFTMFDTYASNYGLMGMGGYFTADPEVASSYTSKGRGSSPTVYPVYLSIKNPLDMDAAADPAAWARQFPDAPDFHEGGDTNESWYRAAEDALSEEGLPKYEGAEVMQGGLRAMGYDGITHMGGGRVQSDGVRHRVYIAFDPEQVKSATGNSGAFDPASADIRMSRNEGQAVSTGNTEASVREALAARFGKIISPMEQRGFLRIWPSVAEFNAANPGRDIEADARGMYDGRAVHLFADSIESSQEVGVFLHEAGEHASMQKMLGDRYQNLLDRARELVTDGDKDALAAQEKIPDDTAAEQRDSELVAYLIETVAGKKPLTLSQKARSWLADTVSAVRAWWSQTAANRTLERFGRGIELTPNDIAALAVRAVNWQSNQNGTSVGAESLATETAAQFSRNPGRSTTGGNVNSVASAAAPWTVSEPGTGDAFIRAIQNNKIDLKRLRDTIAEQYGPMPSRVDAYLGEELYHGKVGARVDQLHKDTIEPLLGKIAVAGKNAGVTVDDVNLYLHARHAPERNAAMQRINPGMANNGGLSGMTDAEAASTMARFRADGKEAALQSIAADVDQLIADTRTNIVADGLEDAGVVQAWQSAYKHYVPLQRDIQGGTPKGMGFSVRGPESKRAVGSNREVVNILANIVAQAETAAIRAEKSEVGRTLLDMARAYPNPDFWKVDVVPTKPRINKDTGLVERNAIDPMYQTAENVVMVKDQGQAHFIVFNKNSERAMAVAHAMKNLDAAPMNKLLTIVGHGTRFLASMLTARNPVFWLTNFARDIQGAMLNLEGTDAEGLQREVLGNLGSAFKGMHALVRGDGRGQWARYAQELKDAGGTTGYMQVFENSDKRMGDIRKEVKRMQQGTADPRRLARQLLDFVDDYNDIIENAVRLSVFQAARDSGVATERAASIAKNITVNFNRKGNLTPVVNSLYMFFNASVQGTARLAQLLASSRKAQVAVGGIAMIGFLLDALNRAMSDDDEETGRNRYDLIPEFEKSKNWIIMNPMRQGEYVKIPLPLGPHVFHNAGRLLSDAMFRRDPRNASEYGWAFANTMMDAFSPLGETASMGQLIAPSIADPFLQLAENKSFTGAPVYKSADRGFGAPDPKPAYTRHFDSTPSIWKQASRTLNDITGGDKHKPGLVNIEPDILKHIAWTLTGGPGRTIDQAVDSLQAGARGVEMTPNRLPVVSRFYGANDDRQRERIYYDDKKRVEKAKSTFDYLNKNGRRDLAREVAEELGNGDYSEGLKMMRGHKGSSSALKKINSQIKREMERVDSGEDRAEQLKALRKRRTEMMSRTINREDAATD